MAAQTGSSKSTMRAPFRRRDFRLLVAGLAISQTGDWLYNVALLVFVLRATHSAAWVAAAGIVRLLPYVLFGTIGGVVADRYSRRRVMIVSDLVRAGIMALLTLVAASSGAAVYAVILAGASTSFAVAYGPSVGAAMPVLVPEDELSAANSITSTISNVAIALGPAIGGVLLVIGSPAIAFGFNAVTFLGSAAAVSAVNADMGPEAHGPEEDGARPPGFLERLSEGVKALVASADVMVLVGAWVANALLYGLEIVLFALIATERLRIGDNGMSFLYASFGLGGIAAATIAHRAANRTRQGVILALTTLIPGLALAGFAITHSAVAGYVLCAADGGASIVLDVLILTSLQRMLGNDVLGRAFGAIDSVVVAGMLAGSLAAPTLVRVAGLRNALAVGGAVVVAAGLLVLQRARGIDRRATEHMELLAPRVKVLSGSGLFEGASRATLEAVAEELTEERVAAGAVVIREGDEPDDLFVTVLGHLIVDADGRGRVAELDAGDYFGEIGLLKRIPRTATVTAASDCTLYRIPGERFLRSVNEDATRTSSLLQNVQSRLATTRPAPREESRA